MKFRSYGISLAISGNTNKALTILDAFIPTFEKDLESYDDEYVKSPFYESLLWTYGYTLLDAKRYTDAQLVFSKLIKLYPDNTKYKKCLRLQKSIGIQQFDRHCGQRVLYYLRLTFYLKNRWGRDLARHSGLR